MTKHFEVVEVKNPTQVATFSGKLRLLGFETLSNFYWGDYHRERLRASVAGLVPMKYEESVI